ncbi:zinc finger protein 622-like isoform X2 [Schistocerca gregaria]|uniref:zinc finger protein 622-like isoform X2 n=1 Tax=Schistocerca gregaria TaxID=7010 RepID=UPI00211EB345|nr:zinc finger protein 622-like isoform X2 [Schistocerca gregaria]
MIVSRSNNSSKFTCLTCRLTFNNSTEQRTHYISDFHCFNLKRKIIQLGPITQETFESKVKALEAKCINPDKINAKCSICQKRFHSKVQYQQHIASKKHILKSQLSGIKKNSSSCAQDVAVYRPVMKTVHPSAEQLETMEDEDIYEYRKENFPKLALEDCLFCRLKFKSLDLNVEHMEYEHGFYIPYRECLIDLEGLIRYLDEKVAIGLICLQCNTHSRQFKTIEAVQKHMRELSHTQISLDTEEEEDEYEPFYDFEGLNKKISELPELQENEFGELVLSDNVVFGNRMLVRYYKQKAYRPSSCGLTKGLYDEYQVVLSKQELLSKMPPKACIDREKVMALKVGLQANKTRLLRFRSDCPI